MAWTEGKGAETERGTYVGKKAKRPKKRRGNEQASSYVNEVLCKE